MGPGLIYLPIHTIALPLLMSWHALLFPDMFSAVQYNVAYIAFSFVVILAIFFRYLRAEFDGLLNINCERSSRSFRATFSISCSAISSSWYYLQ
jgi:hypothetical protein